MDASPMLDAAGQVLAALAVGLPVMFGALRTAGSAVTQLVDLGRELRDEAKGARAALARIADRLDDAEYVRLRTSIPDSPEELCDADCGSLVPVTGRAPARVTDREPPIRRVDPDPDPPTEEEPERPQLPRPAVARAQAAGLRVATARGGR